MKVKEAYNIWAEQYDTNQNKTRDAEAVALRQTLSKINFDNCLEIGCGTGKNTSWIITKAKTVTAIDLSNEMLAKARSKVATNNVTFIQADINEDWNFAVDKKFDLVTFSLVLEHIEDLNKIFEKLNKAVAENGHVYIGELHPFKQYSGTKARFETEQGLQVVPCFNHHISDFTNAAKNNGFALVEVNEYFDDNDRTTVPRIFTMVMKKQ